MKLYPRRIQLDDAQTLDQSGVYRWRHRLLRMKLTYQATLFITLGLMLALIVLMNNPHKWVYILVNLIMLPVPLLILIRLKAVNADYDNLAFKPMSQAEWDRIKFYARKIPEVADLNEALLLMNRPITKIERDTFDMLIVDWCSDLDDEAIRELVESGQLFDH